MGKQIQISLTEADIALYLGYCDKMIEYVGDREMARRSWREAKKDLERRQTDRNSRRTRE